MSIHIPTIAFSSHKGGSGRSFICANCARTLALGGANVLLIDLDLGAPGLPYYRSPFGDALSFSADRLIHYPPPREAESNRNAEAKLLSDESASKSYTFDYQYKKNTGTDTEVLQRTSIEVNAAFLHGVYDLLHSPAREWRSGPSAYARFRALYKGGNLQEYFERELHLYESYIPAARPEEGRVFCLPSSGFFLRKVADNNKGDIELKRPWVYHPFSRILEGSVIELVDAFSNVPQSFLNEDNSGAFGDLLGAVSVRCEQIGAPLDYILLDMRPGHAQHAVPISRCADATVYISSGSPSSLLGAMAQMGDVHQTTIGGRSGNSPVISFVVNQTIRDNPESMQNQLSQLYGTLLDINALEKLSSACYYQYATDTTLDKRHFFPDRNLTYYQGFYNQRCAGQTKILQSRDNYKFIDKVDGDRRGKVADSVASNIWEFFGEGIGKSTEELLKEEMFAASDTAIAGKNNELETFKNHIASLKQLLLPVDFHSAYRVREYLQRSSTLLSHADLSSRSASGAQDQSRFFLYTLYALSGHIRSLGSRVKSGQGGGDVLALHRRDGYVKNGESARQLKLDIDFAAYANQGDSETMITLEKELLKQGSWYGCYLLGCVLLDNLDQSIANGQSQEHIQELADKCSTALHNSEKLRYTCIKSLPHWRKNSLPEDLVVKEYLKNLAHEINKKTISPKQSLVNLSNIEIANNNMPLLDYRTSVAFKRLIGTVIKHNNNVSTDVFSVALKSIHLIPFVWSDEDRQSVKTSLRSELDFAAIWRLDCAIAIIDNEVKSGALLLDEADKESLSESKVADMTEFGWYANLSLLKQEKLYLSSDRAECLFEYQPNVAVGQMKELINANKDVPSIQNDALINMAEFLAKWLNDCFVKRMAIYAKDGDIEKASKNADINKEVKGIEQNIDWLLSSGGLENHTDYAMQRYAWSMKAYKAWIQYDSEETEQDTREEKEILDEARKVSSHRGSSLAGDSRSHDLLGQLYLSFALWGFGKSAVSQTLRDMNREMLREFGSSTLRSEEYDNNLPYKRALWRVLVAILNYTWLRHGFFKSASNSSGISNPLLIRQIEVQQRSCFYALEQFVAILQNISKPDQYFDSQEADAVSQKPLLYLFYVLRINKHEDTEVMALHWTVMKILLSRQVSNIYGEEEVTSSHTSAEHSIGYGEFIKELSNFEPKKHSGLKTELADRLVEKLKRTEVV